MKNRYTIREFTKNLNLYFDNELQDEDAQQFLNQRDADPACNKVFNKEKNFRDFIKNNVKRPSVSPDLIRSIKDKVRIV